MLKSLNKFEKKEQILTQEKSTGVSVKAWFLLIFLSIVWGTSFIFVKKIVHNFNAVELGAGRIFIAGLALSPWAIIKFKEFPKAKAGYLLLSGLLGYLIPAIIFGVTGSKIDSSLAGALNATTPLFVLLTGVLFFSKKIASNHIIGISVGFLGSLILILSGSSHILSFDNPYSLLIMGATVMYGLNANILGSKLNNVSPIIISAYSLLFVGLIAFVILLNTEFFSKILLIENRNYLYYFLFLGVMNSGIAAFLYNYTLQISSPLFASSVTYIIPVVATLVGIFDGEKVGIYLYLGMIITLIGVYILNRKK
jgi:drug/metabolite transporter (DMT)-like permease